jgi:fatty acid desaturase
MARRAQVEWPTLLLLAATYAAWGLAVFALPGLALWLAVPLVAWAIAQHSSLQHEVIHGHPFGAPRLNAAVVWPALGLLVPLRALPRHAPRAPPRRGADRPYDDPRVELPRGGRLAAPAASAARAPRAQQHAGGRILVGPLVGQVAFMRGDWRLIRSGDRRVLATWLAHGPAAAAVLLAVALSPMPLWAYALAAYGAMSLLKIRTFLEHQAHERARGRTAVIEDRGPLALLFLNNNFHVVHHMHPRVPWYRLPALYDANRARYLGVNEGYRYGSYAEVFRRHLLRAKDPVAHPHLRR